MRERPAPRETLARRRTRLRTLAWLGAFALLAAGLVIGARSMLFSPGSAVAPSRDAGAPGEAPASSAVPIEGLAASEEPTTSAEATHAATGITIAWQPSHQADTGANGWQEYVICGDIVDRAMAALPEYGHVKAWDLTHGLTGSNNYKPKPSNTPAFDAELALADEAGALVFISVHNDGGAPSGVLGECLPGDPLGRALVETLVEVLCERTGLPNRGIREVRLYSLEAPRNTATYRCLLEIGDNAADRTFLEDPANRERIAAALAEGVRRADLRP